MWEAAVAWINALFPIVSSSLNKLEQDKKAFERTDIRDALFQLLHLLREWDYAAKNTNLALSDWLEKGKPVNYEPLNQYIASQWGKYREVSYVAGLPSLYGLEQKGQGKRKLKQKQKSDRTLLTVLFVYEPKLEEFFQQAIDQRIEQLIRLREELYFWREGKVSSSTFDKAVKYLSNNSSVSVYTSFTVTELKEFNNSLQQLEKLNYMLAAFIAKNFELKGVAVEDLTRIKEYAA